MSGMTDHGTGAEEPSERAERWPQRRSIHLQLSSLGSVVVDEPDVRSLRAEDASGGFGLWPGHVDFLTVLTVGVVSWRVADGRWRHCAVRRGVMTLRRGCELQIATREAVVGDDLQALEREVLAGMSRRQKVEDDTRRQTREMEIRVLSELVRPVRALRAPATGAP